MNKEARAEAAAKYRPKKVRLLLVAEAPPDNEERYFYFEDVQEQDSLFRYVVQGVLGYRPGRVGKSTALSALRDKGVFLLDASEKPLGNSPLRVAAQEVAVRCGSLQPEAIILIKSNVYDDLFGPLARAGLPVVDKRMPFPGSDRRSLKLPSPTRSRWRGGRMSGDPPSESQNLTS